MSLFNVYSEWLLWDRWPAVFNSVGYIFFVYNDNMLDEIVSGTYDSVMGKMVLKYLEIWGKGQYRSRGNMSKMARAKLFGHSCGCNQDFPNFPSMLVPFFQLRNHIMHISIVYKMGMFQHSLFHLPVSDSLRQFCAAKTSERAGPHFLYYSHYN